MEISEIVKHCDHTLLSPAATLAEIKELCEDALFYRAASVCVPPCYVKNAREYMGRNGKVCTVVGFPNGYNTKEVKLFETARALNDGADEIDMVINVGYLKDKKYDLVEGEIKALKKACGAKVLKVIVETCLLTDEEKIKMCEIVTDAGADYIKTSTGFSKGGATKADVELFSKHIGKDVKIKAAGGIRTVEAAEEFLRLGCDRLGASAIVTLAKGEKK
jgi:deoxyribose-phosphate aldolase